MKKITLVVAISNNRAGTHAALAIRSAATFAPTPHAGAAPAALVTETGSHGRPRRRARGTAAGRNAGSESRPSNTTPSAPAWLRSVLGGRIRKWTPASTFPAETESDSGPCCCIWISV